MLPQVQGWLLIFQCVDACVHKFLLIHSPLFGLIPLLAIMDHAVDIGVQIPL
jgi:hypothetical protein